MSQITFFEWFDRMGRPALRMVGVLVLAVIGLALAFAFWRSAFTGVPVPDMTGGMGPLLIAIGPQCIDLVTRHMQRAKEIALGQQPGRALPNPHGGGPDTP